MPLEANLCMMRMFVLEFVHGGYIYVSIYFVIPLSIGVKCLKLFIY